MCGILGFSGDNITGDLFSDCLSRLSHRGPDGSGTWREDGMWLGHRRLSIIDLSENASQPMELLGRYVITFNGEIYNYKELRIELKKLNYQFKSNSDTEILLYSYIHWGHHFLNKLNGMWALGIWDKKEKTLFLSRDRIGKKPLFYSSVRNGFAFASEMKALYPLLNTIEKDVENISFAIHHNFIYEATEKCLIKNIKRFPAGSYGIFKDGKLKIEKFWKPLEQHIIVPLKYVDQVEYFRELFFDSCKIRMRSDVTIGTALSGGLDSSAVICAMNYVAWKSNIFPDLSGKGEKMDWQHAFCATFPGTYYDETEYAKAVTDYIGTKADFIEIDPVRELNDLFRQAYMFEEIYYAPTIPFVQLYRKIGQAGVKVSIDGHGADELFGGYSFDIDAALIDALPDLLQMIGIAWHQIPKKEFADKLRFALINKYPRLQKFVKNPVLQKKYGELDFLNSRLYESTYRTMMPTLLRNYDRYSMMNGVEIRMPFLDYRILQFAFSIPYRSKIRNGFTKVIVRDALKGIIPDKIRNRRSKVGFNSPMDVWAKRKEFREWLLDEMDSNDFKTSSIINPADVKSSINMLIEGSANPSNASILFEKIIPYIWEKGLKMYGGLNSNKQ